MAPWNRLRPDRSSEKDLKKQTPTHSRPQSSQQQSRPQSQQQQSRPQSRQRGIHEATPSSAVENGSRAALSPRRNHQTRDSVVSMSVVNDSPAKTITAAEEAESQVPVIELPEDEKLVPRPHRFSLLRFRHASDSQLSKTAQSQASPPPVPITPSIITTAPTSENLEQSETHSKRRSTFSLARRSRAFPKQTSLSELQANRDSQATPVPAGRISFDPGTKSQNAQPRHAPPPYGDESNSSLALPVSRVSESSRSDASSGDHRLYAQTTTTHTVSTTTTFFRLPRRKKDKGPLFPLPPKTSSNLSSVTNTPRLSTTRDSESPARPSFTDNENARQSPIRQAMRREDSQNSSNSQTEHSRPSLLEQRGRSSTLSSLRRKVADDEPMPTPPLPLSTRTSTSTSGRPSLGGLFGINRIKQNDGLALRALRNGDPGTPASLDSKQNSFNLPREPAVVIPERQDGDTPAKYLARLEEVVNQGALVAVLSKSDDEFMRNVLRSYMRRFKFFEDPLDMAIRKMLMYVELPKETQQIDRTLQSFSDRYHECNPGIFASVDDAYFIAFSILILHTDVFNKNNKHKMTKQDYIKNAMSRGGITPDILECFYDNISYTTFIHLEDDVHISSDRMTTPKPTRKSALKSGGTPKRSQTGPVDPYALILENRLDSLRPELEDVLIMDDSFNFIVPNAVLNISELNKSFFRSGVIQILSARSRPEAFANQATITNPLEASVGVVDIKVTKVGVLWRKDPKKKKTRSPWQEWGAVLTGSQLYFFRNASWVKNLMHQYEQFYKSQTQGPVVFKPPLEQFKPDFLVSLDDAVALVDSRYKKHKNAFLFTRQDSFAEVLLADNEVEYRDWIAKINYAAAFRSAGVRMRGNLGSLEPRESRDTATAASSVSNDSIALGDDLSRLHTRPEDLSEEQQIIIARRQIMAQKIQEADARIRGIERVIESQLRNGRHLKILTPIQQRTRDDVTLSSLTVAEALRATQVTNWRLRCYRKILALDLEDDIGIQKDRDRSVDGDSKEATPQTSRESEKSRIPFVRLGSKNSGSSAQRPGRPSNQPTGQKIFSMDEIFRTPSRFRAQGHKPKASWELPPINFDRRKSASQTRFPREVDEQVIEDTEEESLKSSSIARESKRRTSSELEPRQTEIDKEERDILVKSGVDPEIIAMQEDKDEDRSKVDADEHSKPGTEEKDSRAKARHSFQRKLQSNHTPSHQRSKKGKESSSTVTGPEDTLNATENQRLTRASGKFTLHGKKASVVTFGSEWQNISPEERLRHKVLPNENEKDGSVDSDDVETAPTDSEQGDIRSPLSAVSDIVSAPSFKSARSSLDQRPSLDDDIMLEAVSEHRQSISSETSVNDKGKEAGKAEGKVTMENGVQIDSELDSQQS